MKADQVWADLLKAGLVQGVSPELSVRSPWFVRVMLGVAGWFGALFLLFFVGLAMSFIFKNAGAALVVGVGACAAAAMLFRKLPEHDFAGQFAFAVSLAGQALIIFGIADAIGKSVGPVAFVMAGVQAALFWLVPNYVHRVWAAWTGVCALALALADGGLSAFTPALVLAAFAWVWLKEFDLAKHATLVRAGGYGLALAAVMVAVFGHGEFSITRILDHPGSPAGGLIGIWIGAGLTAAALLWAVVQLLAREHVPLESAQGRIALAGALILALATLKAPGIGPAAAVLVIGFANGNRILAGLGILAMLGYLSHYYYSLQITLLEKSAVLAATGVALLAARLALLRYWPASNSEEVPHA